jgi:uncharacterized membrane protein
MRAEVAQMDFYPWLKTLHILLAIVAVGFNMSYGIWLARAAREPQQYGYVLRGIKFLDDRVANPAYGGLLLVGLLLIFIGPYDLSDTWVLIAIGLYVLMGAVAILLYSPTLSRQIAAYEDGGPGSPAFLALGSRARMLGIVLAVILLLILVMMVVKPGS